MYSRFYGKNMDECKLYSSNFQLQQLHEHNEKYDLELGDKPIKSVKFRITPLIMLVSQKSLTSNETQIDMKIDEDKGDSILEAMLTELEHEEQDFLSYGFASKYHNDKSNNGIYYSTSVAS